jgi:hypothetical protein
LAIDNAELDRIASLEVQVRLNGDDISAGIDAGFGEVAVSSGRLVDVPDKTVTAML